MAKPRGKHTCPEYAGEQNMTPEALEAVNAKPTGDEAEFLEKMIPIYKKSVENMKKNREDYSGKWTEETLAASTVEFFEYCKKNNIEPSPAVLRLWLGISRETIDQWRKGGTKEDFKTDIIKRVYDMMESRYFSKLDKYAVSNIFKLKTVHGYVEPNRIEVDTVKPVTEDDVDARIAELNIGK